MFDDLAADLRVRTRRLTEHPFGEGPVVYWMRTAVRADDNPALEVAAAVSAALRRPMFVYHAVSERYPYASDRHHRFILEGARDVATALEARGIAHAFHLERPGHDGPVLRRLAETAALLVTEEMPVRPLREWTRHLADRAPAPVWAVDTATVVPMRWVGKGYDRAFRYRERIEPVLDRFVEPAAPVSPFASELPEDLPFEPFDLRGDLGEAIAHCRIDHTVPPVVDVRGGSRAAESRWRWFVDHALERYAADRNDPLRDGTSRLSPWLHYGMLAPRRVAREARRHGGRGAKKFVDELVVWRELPATWCLYHRHHDSLEALPPWARTTLRAHASDPRPFQPSLDRLHRGRTGVALWDVAQRSLLRHGWLHNNVRMTWAKALLEWSPSPEEALRRMLDLNHRYALDGRDPGSYGGILWCLGQFDRPFPESPIRGTVRGRSVTRHAKRVDVDTWSDRIDRPRGVRVALVEAGWAGRVAARILADHGVDVVLVDDPTTLPPLPDAVDDPVLQRLVENWTDEGVWDATGASLAAHLGAEAHWQPPDDAIPDVTGWVVGAEASRTAPAHIWHATVPTGDVAASLCAGMAAAGRFLGRPEALER